MYFLSIWVAMIVFTSPASAADCILSFDNSCIREQSSPPEYEVEEAYRYRMQTLAQMRHERETQERAELLADLSREDADGPAARNLRQRLVEELIARISRDAMRGELPGP